MSLRQPAFGERLRALRMEAGLRQQDLAGEQVSAAYISMLERGRRTPSLGVVEYLAEQLGCSPARLREDKRPAPTPSAEVLSDGLPWPRRGGPNWPLEAAQPGGGAWPSAPAEDQLATHECLALVAEALARLAVGDREGAQASMFRAAHSLTPQDLDHAEASTTVA